MHFELSERGGDLTGLARTAYVVFAGLLPVTDATVARALDLDLVGLAAKDRIHVAICLERGIDAIVSADAGFERVKGITRTDPLDTRAVTRLLRS